MAEIKVWRLLANLGIATAMTAGIVPSQSLLDQVNFRSVSLGGFRLYGVSAFGGYSTSPLPTGFGQAFSSGLQELGGSANYGAGASFGWRPRRKEVSIGVFYSLSYGGDVRYSDLNALSQSFSVNADRKLSRRWSLSVSGAAQDGTLGEYLHQPSALSVLSQLPATFDDLAAAFSIGQFSNTQMASMLTGANVLESPARGLLLGDRVLSYSGNVGLTYAHSSRLSFHFSSVSGGGQNRRGGTNGTPEEKIILPRSMAISAGMALSYAFSPRTGIGLNVEESRTINKYQNAYSTSGTASISRKMGMHWFLSVNAGGAITRMTSQSFSGASTSPQVVGGGSLGYQLRTQTFVGTYQRSSSDGFGFAAGANTTATAGWTWRRPGSRWTVFASGGQHQIRGAGFASLSGWETAGGISASLDAHTSLSGQYVYFNSQGSYGGTFNNMIVHSVRVSLGWTPQTAQRH